MYVYIVTCTPLLTIPRQHHLQGRTPLFTIGHMMRRQSSGPSSPWGTRETKKRIVDALKSENSEIYSYTGDIAVTGCAKVNYAKIQELYTPKHNMNKFCPNLKRLIECKMHMMALLGNPFGIPRNSAINLIWTFRTPEFSSEFYFSDRKMCSRQF